MSTFRALRVNKQEDGSYVRTTVERDTSELPAGDVLISVAYSSLNYKDALSATGAPGVTRNYPHTPGIDAAGTVAESTSAQFNEGDQVVVIGFDLGMDTDGGFGQFIRVPESWIVRLPEGLSLRESMILGTAGFTAALCVHKLEQVGMSPDAGPVLVTGATGGVGSVAVSLLSDLGYEVHAVTGKSDQDSYLKSLGATTLHVRSDYEEENRRPLGRETWGGVVDTTGGAILVNALKELKYGQSLAACGLVSSPSIAATVFPFILRHVNLLGIDSVELPLAQKAAIWEKLATGWRVGGLESMVKPLSLDTLSESIDQILIGKMIGRGLVDMHS